MKEAAEEILQVLTVLRKAVSDTPETRHLLDLFETMLTDDSALEEEAYFLEHGEPRTVAGMSIADLFADMDEGPGPPPDVKFEQQG